MLICLSDNIVVWFCLLHRKPSADLKTIVQRAIMSPSSLCWIYPKCNRQNGNYECGYYVMHRIWTIARYDIVDTWGEIFKDKNKLDTSIIEEMGLLNQYMNDKKGSCGMEVVEEKHGEDEYILAGRSSLNVGKMVDGYLGEIAQDPDLGLSSFVDLSQSIPGFARQDHDGLYRAIDIYLKEHPELTKAERKKLCGLMDVRKLTADVRKWMSEMHYVDCQGTGNLLY
ncbi:BTB/POZ domain-containing protein NPY3 [Vigna radiata var. radiata]|uniref:BTB/POZ domain-containing protein NPY3 n=1 Tax=Vigna radiata var. radiata TaxID=3916 RepID=A0A3Q0F2G2_VIGRR|nr:BTB/POZ domain-containing protein NPY3 [Vigna radiata var. radiata]